MRTASGASVADPQRGEGDCEEGLAPSVGGQGVSVGLGTGVAVTSLFISNSTDPQKFE